VEGALERIVAGLSSSLVVALREVVSWPATISPTQLARARGDNDKFFHKTSTTQL